jgi:hypothetical protein
MDSVQARWVISATGDSGQHQTALRALASGHGYRNSDFGLRLRSSGSGGTAVLGVLMLRPFVGRAVFASAFDLAVEGMVCGHGPPRLGFFVVTSHPPSFGGPSQRMTSGPPSTPVT